MRTQWLSMIGVALTGITTATLSAQAQTNTNVVDFRYALPWWQTSICMPDDPEKPLVGKEGQFLFDFGAGGPRNFAFSLTPDVQGGAKWVKQETASAKAPVVCTSWDADGVQITTQAFHLIPMRHEPTPIANLVSANGLSVVRAWGNPRVSADSAFSDILVGNGGAQIAYDLKVRPHAQIKAVFGFCEGWWSKPQQRPLKLGAEGAESRVVDPVADFGKNVPGVYVLDANDQNGDGIIRITVDAIPGAPDTNVILNALWAFAGQEPSHEAIVRGMANDSAYAFVRAADGSPLSHQYASLMTFTNSTKAPRRISPIVRITGVNPVTFSRQANLISIGGSTRLSASAQIDSCDKQADTWTAHFAELELPAGASEQIALTILRNGRAPFQSLSAASAERERQRAIAWWDNADLPWGAIQTPDPGIQGMLESCVRNIWQAREIKNGKPAFYVGPTCYHGLWVVDGSFLLESAALVGRAKDARAGIDYILSFQKPDGGMDVMGGGLFHKENGIVLWMCSRHAALTQDKAWLLTEWPKLERIVEAIKRLRQDTRKTPDALFVNLMPTGFTDGGIGGNNAEYSNVYWNLVGLKAIVQAAQWLGKTDEANAWRAEYDDFMAAFRKAADRDMATDPHGNRYLPTIMGPEGKRELPQRGQWAFMQSVYPGQLFANDDPLVVGNLAMLRATKQQGLVFGTGWDAEGIWTYAASFYGHAILWQGAGQEAAQVLYDYANHAAPVRVWREEQRPVGKGGNEVGDMPHNWASAEFIRLTTHLLELDRGTELHLLEGLPAQWLGANMVTSLNAAPTPFGPLTMRLQVDSTGKSATLEYRALKPECTAVVVHLPGGATRRLSAAKPTKLTFELDLPNK